MRLLRIPRLAVLAVLLASLVGALVSSPVISPVAATTEDPPQERVRAQIVKLAKSQADKVEKGGEDHYPPQYRVDDTVYRPGPWCGVFVNWAWTKSGATGPNMIDTRPTTPWSKRWNTDHQGHWATYWQKWAKANNRWKSLGSKDVRPGDAVVYGEFNQSGHIGVVVEVKRDKKGKPTHVKTVEGNLGDMVKAFKWRKIPSLTGGGFKASGFVSPV